ncbi:MAG TPA: cytochrome c biogenesis protein CcdA [Bryobacteraceae bacterium]|nr:cytochrome c biogenesis protein CcdA [Bryobacteraceae bacterium]
MLRPLLISFVALASLAGAAEDPVQWTLTSESKSAAPGSHVLAKFTGTIEQHWHVYSMTTPPGGPNKTTAVIADNPAVAGFRIYQAKPVRKLDASFGIDTETFSDQYVLLFDIELKKDAAAGPVDIAANVRYQSCNDTICLPPKKKSATASLTIDASAKGAAIAIPTGYTLVPTPVSGAAATSSVQPATQTPPTPPGAPVSGEFGLGFVLTAFAAGIAAIFTPCVFPMIPFTVSYFVNRQTRSKTQGVLQALAFCLGIIVFFTGIGALIKVLVGSAGVVQLGNSPWVNGFIGALFVVFGLSLLGAYELALPSGLLTRLNQASDGGGYFGSLLMGLTFTLTSFACIGPFMGSLLAGSVQGGGLQPVVGMAAFATGLSAPFFALAVFPSFLQKMPKSGGWLLRVKVVLGFVVLAISVKYLSSADQILQTDWISREMFLASWVVLFALPGLYLLGFLRLEGIKAEDSLGVGRVLIAALFLTFSISLLPGLFGGSLGNVEAFIPVQAKGNALLAGGSESAAPVWMKNQYKEALAKARAENKLVFINFTGYACTNCHWMKANMFPRPEVTGLLKDFVLLDLYTDGTDAESEQNQQLEEKRFATVAIPFYAIVDPDERTIATFPGLTRNASAFVTFLKTRATGVASTAPGTARWPSSLVRDRWPVAMRPQLLASSVPAVRHFSALP